LPFLKGVKEGPRKELVKMPWFNLEGKNWEGSLINPFSLEKEERRIFLIKDKL